MPDGDEIQSDDEEGDDRIPPQKTPDDDKLPSEEEEGDDRNPPQDVLDDDGIPSMDQDGSVRIPSNYEIAFSDICLFEEAYHIHLFNSRN